MPKEKSKKLFFVNYVGSGCGLFFRGRIRIFFLKYGSESGSLLHPVPQQHRIYGESGELFYYGIFMLVTQKKTL